MSDTAPTGASPEMIPAELKPGFYWVKWDEAGSDDPRWEPAELRDDGCWLPLGESADCHVPKLVGTRIIPMSSETSGVEVQ